MENQRKISSSSNKTRSFAKVVLGQLVRLQSQELGVQLRQSKEKSQTSPPKESGDWDTRIPVSGCCNDDSKLVAEADVLLEELRSQRTDHAKEASKEKLLNILKKRKDILQSNFDFSRIKEQLESLSSGMLCEESQQEVKNDILAVFEKLKDLTQLLWSKGVTFGQTREQLRASEERFEILRCADMYRQIAEHRQLEVQHERVASKSLHLLNSAESLLTDDHSAEDSTSPVEMSRACLSFVCRCVGQFVLGFLILLAASSPYACYRVLRHAWSYILGFPGNTVPPDFLSLLTEPFCPYRRPY